MSESTIVQNGEKYADAREFDERTRFAARLAELTDEEFAEVLARLRCLSLSDEEADHE